MISLVEALRYRCLRDVSQTLGPFQILVGPNASGKSTFLDVAQLLADLLRGGLNDAVSVKRSPDLKNLVWMQEAESFEMAIELPIPEARRERLKNGQRMARYEVAVGHTAAGELSILGETLWLKPESEPVLRQLEIFPEPAKPRPSLSYPEGRHSPHGWKKVLSKKPDSGNDYFFSETTGWQNPFRLGPRKLGLANLPEDEEKFPVATWVKRVLLEGVQRLMLNCEVLRRPSPPGSPLEFQPDGSNLPRAVEALRNSDPARFDRWLAHVRTALPDVRTVETVEREEDRHRYLQVCYDTGLRAPSWALSDGTLRLLALTLLAYIDPPGRIFLIEEPENGIHPQAVECVFQALSSAYESQILCASHSPVILSLAEPSQLLCFARSADGATGVVRGDEHPALKAWKRGLDLGTLFASGVLG